ncbi:MAG TPA: MaoC family dehydratase N-terminal domain-containing protein [Xanthomonadales bacterium]|nr:MaoC family dehydratase N-terminal domain-containing protein [Xanthomonadales bacterium]
MLDRSLLDSVISRFEVPVEAGRVALFREAIGEAPHSPGSSLGAPVPLTFIGLGLDPEPFDFVRVFDRDLGSLLHANQSIRYHKPIFVGDVLKGCKKVVGIFDKKHGQLEFLVLELEYMNQHQELVGVSQQTLVFVRKTDST